MHALFLFAAAFGCKNDQGLTEIRLEKVAVASGDFDRIEEALLRNDVASDIYEGYIVQPVYDTEAEGEVGDSVLQVEKLFTELDEDGDPLLFGYDALFVNSGVRGLGAFVYNDVDPDDALVRDAEVIALTEDYVGRGKTLVVSDWSYDLVEAIWPDRIAFLNESDGLDAAQRGVSDSVIADVVDKDLAAALGTEQIELFYDFSYWAVMLDAAPGATVYLRGDVDWRTDDGSGSSRLEDVPLLVGFEHSGGRVIYSAFSWRAQRPQIADLLLLGLVGGVEQTTRGSGTEGELGE